MSNQGLLIGTVVFIFVGFLVYFISAFKISQTFPLKEKQTYYKSIARSMCVMGSICMWAHWICCYMHQMNPLLKPIPQSH